MARIKVRLNLELYWKVEFIQICDHLPNVKALPKVDRGILSSSSLYASLPDWPSLLGDFDLGHLKLLKGDLDLVRDFADPLPPNVALLLLSTLDVPEPLLPDTLRLNLN